MKGQVAIITGGSRGIGLAIAHAFRAQGAHVVIASRKAEGLAAARAELLAVEADGDVHTVVANAGEPDQAERCVEETMARFGRLDILVNNAATNPYYGSTIDVPPSMFDKTFEVNLRGPLYWAREAHRQGFGDHPGVIINGDVTDIFG